MILCLGTTPAVQRVMVFPRLTAGEVNRAARTVEGAAGKSVNVAKVLRALGEPVVATGFLGGERGLYLQQILQSRGVATDFVIVPVPTRQCVTLIEESTGTVTELVEESAAVAETAYRELLDRVERHLAEGKPQAVVMSGTIATGGPPDLYARVTRAAQAAGARAVVDAAGPPLREALAVGPDVVKPNRAELAATVGRPLPDEPAVLEAMRELHGRGARQVVVTAGAHPTLAFDGRGFWRLRTAPLTPVNPIGSGDAFTAALVARLGRGDDLGAACRWAAAAGAVNALSLLAGEVDPGDVEAWVKRIEVERVR